MNPVRPVSDIDMDMCLSYNETCGLNLDVIQSKAMPATCTDFLVDVTFLGEKIKCEDIFKLDYTTNGLCYTTSEIKKPLTYSRENIGDTRLSIVYLAPEGFGLDVCFVHLASFN